MKLGPKSVHSHPIMPISCSIWDECFWPSFGTRMARFWVKVSWWKRVKATHSTALLNPFTSIVHVLNTRTVTQFHVWGTERVYLTEVINWQCNVIPIRVCYSALNTFMAVLSVQHLCLCILLLYGLLYIMENCTLFCCCFLSKHNILVRIMLFLSYLAKNIKGTFLFQGWKSGLMPKYIHVYQIKNLGSLTLFYI